MSVMNLALAYHLDRISKDGPTKLNPWKYLYKLFTKLHHGSDENCPLNIPPHRWNMFEQHPYEHMLEAKADLKCQDLEACIKALAHDDTAGGCLLGYDGIQAHHLGNLYEDLLSCCPLIENDKFKIDNTNKVKNWREQGLRMPPEAVHLIVRRVTQELYNEAVNRLAKRSGIPNDLGDMTQTRQDSGEPQPSTVECIERTESTQREIDTKLHQEIPWTHSDNASESGMLLDAGML